MEKTLINLGSGIKLIRGFINVDIAYDFDRPNYVKADVRKLPFKDNYADYILARQIIEHIPIREVIKTMREWLRVLKPGGSMVITCPDFNYLAKTWLEAEFDPRTFQNLSEGIYGNQRTDKEYHLTPITPDFMKYCLDVLDVKNYQISVYPAGSPSAEYPGYKEPKGNAYRYDDIHIILNK